MKTQINTNSNTSNDPLIDHIQANIFLVNVNQDGTFAYVKINKFHEEATGYSSEFLIGKSPTEAMGEEMGSKFEVNYRRCLEKGESISYEELLDFPAGVKNWLTKLSPIWKAGRIVQIAGVSTDITERKKNEQLLKELYNKTNTALNTGKLAWWEMELPSGKISFDSNKAKMLGYSPDQFNHYKDFTNLIHPDDYEKTMQAMRDHIDGKNPLYKVAYRIRRKTGEYMWFNDVGSLTEKDDKTGKLKFIGMAQDISSQKLAERRLQEKGNYLKITLNSIGDAIISTDTKGMIVEMNPVAEQLTGWTIKSAIGKPLTQVIKMVSATTDEKSNSPEHLTLISKDGTRKHIKVSKSPIKDANGKNYGKILVIRDVTLENKTKERLELAMDAGEHGFWDYNLETNESYYSPGYFGMLGYQPDELPMKPETWPDLIHPEDRKRILPQIEDAVSKSQPYNKEIRMKCKDGSYKWISVRGNTYYQDKRGKPQRVVGVHVDIDELKRKTEALKESHRMAKMGRWDYYHKNDHLEWNEEILEILDLDSGKSLTNFQSFLEKVHPDDRKKVDRAWKKMIETHLPYNIEHRLLMEDGSIKWVKEYSRTEYDQQNVPHHSIGIMQDITEQKTMELELRKSEEKFRNLFQKHLAVQLIIDPKTKHILDANEAALNFYGYTKRELKQMKITQINTLSQEEINFEVEKAQTNQREYLQFKDRLANGEIRDVEVFNNELEIDGKRVIHAIVHDITEKKKYERELIEAKQRAEAANVAKSEFLSTMSHELRTPLNGVIGFSEILKLTGLNHEQNEYLDTVLSSAKNLLVIISDILEYSKIDAKSFKLNPEKTDLNQLIKKTCSIIQRKAVRQGLEFSVDFDESIPQSVHVDYGKLKQIILNLLSNAVKFTKNGGVYLQLRTMEKSDDKVKILFQVTDTGIGIKEKDMEIIFQAFQQADMSTTRRFEGIGLGITISNNLLKKMGSTLKLKSTYGKGSTFYFELELPYEKERPTDSNRTRSENNEKVPTSTRKKILIAEDNPVNMHYAQTAISMFSNNIEVIRAKNGKEAYELFLKHAPDLILMDVIMPDIDGYMATRMIRSKDEKIPIIAMTAKASKNDKEACLNAGMSEYITKPFSLDRLREMLKRYLK